MLMAFALGVIGGSGIYDIEGLEDVREVDVETPYGSPSAPIVSGRLQETRLFFLPRHGRGHRIAPHEINFRANVCAMKKLGATHLISLSAVGSMKEEIEPGHVVVVDQYIDLTKRRTSTFFEGGMVAHVSLADPVCPLLSAALGDAAERAGAKVHRGGTYVCMEGPQFSTRAESRVYRSWGVSVIGMTAQPEAKLAREAELPYATLALATDYDCWHETEEDVSVESILAVLHANVALAKRTVAFLASHLPDPTESPATGALKYAVITDPKSVDASARRRLDWILGSG
jgi:5'-methylthioadenosine phosphorylase